MQKIHFSIVINASREKVWDVMLDDTTYRQWTMPFHPGSYYKGGWNTGDEILFLGPGEAGKESGMVSQIKESRLHEFVSIEHLGMITDGVKDTTSDEVKKWMPAFENYTFKDVEGGTELLIDVDVPEEWKNMLNESWPKALEILKEIAERKA